MTDLTVQAEDGVQAAEPAPRSPRAARLLVGAQLYIVAAYLCAAVVPYLWRDRPAPPTWLWAGPAWLLGVPGFWVAVLGPTLALPLAFVGVVAAANNYDTAPTRTRWWCVAAAAVSVAYAVFSLTPPGRALAAFAAD